MFMSNTGTLELVDRALLRYELDRIANTLNEMSEKHWGWDFWVPILTAGVVAIIASVITYWFQKRIQKATDKKAKEWHEQNQRIDMENRKRAAINELTQMANSCYVSLANIRHAYSSELSSDIRERIFNVESIHVVPLVPVDLNILTRLFFLTPRTKAEETKWSQFSRIENVLRDYNLVMFLWEERNKQLPDFYLKLDATPNKPPPQMRKEVFSMLPDNLFFILFQSTERCISMTKQVSIELLDLIENFDKAYSKKLSRDLPNHLLDDLYEVSSETIKARKTQYDSEVLADFSYLKKYGFEGASYQEKVKGLISRYDYHKYGITS